MDWKREVGIFFDFTVSLLFLLFIGSIWLLGAMMAVVFLVLATMEWFS